MTEVDKLWYKSWPKGIKKVIEIPNTTVHGIFEEIALKKDVKDITYMSLLGIDYSYSKVNEMADRFASALIELGVKKGDHIGILMPNLHQFSISFFGILKAGAITVPLSPLYGPSDLKAVLQKVDLKGIVALDILYEKIEETEVKIPLVITTALGDILSPIMRFVAKLIGKLPKSPKILGNLELYELINTHEPLKEKISVEPEDVASIGSTGGTTGVPKAAMLTHRNLVANMMWLKEWPKMVHPEGTHKKYIGLVPFFHIIGLVGVMLSSIVLESTVYLVPDPRKFEDILKLLSKEKIHYMHGVPTLYRALLRHPKFDKYDLSSLDLVFSGAAPLPAVLAEEFESKINGLVMEAYGLTETAPIVSSNPFEKDNRKTGSIGIPFIGTDVEIRNPETDAVMPQGEIGEICVKGPQIMKGYYKDPEATAQVIKNGWFYTGDLGYFDEDGFLFLVNRIKDMINASGYKVYPREIEELIYNDFPQISEAIVIASPDEYRGETVKLIVVLKDGEKLTKKEITSHLESKIAAYKVPKKIEFMDSLPKSGLGKPDRKALRERESMGL
ncbi:MAG: long-chain fatty acid--CoA ligase [Promethearchaeota archaeon]|nr:MAG: long-chain fatty acid--CoA ligase [Candidatus Lokiarchaeota archaeon]